MTILVFAEHDGNTLLPATRSAVSAAMKLGGEIHLLVAGSGVQAVADQASKIQGVGKVLIADAPHYAGLIAEEIAPLLVKLAPNYSHMVAAATTTGKNIFPRAAAKLDVQQISDITEVISADSFVRPIYAGNAFATVKSADSIKLITARQTAFDKAGDGGSASVESMEATPAAGKAKFVGLQAAASERPELTSARVVVSGGRGVGSAENFSFIEKLADRLNAAIGASRAAVDAGYVANDLQVGQTGKVVAPELYIAVGISGAIQHLAGMKESKVIVAINKDENAPIFEIADYGLVGDLFQILPELEKALS